MAGCFYALRLWYGFVILGVFWLDCLAPEAFNASPTHDLGGKCPPSHLAAFVVLSRYAVSCLHLEDDSALLKLFPILVKLIRREVEHVLEQLDRWLGSIDVPEVAFVCCCIQDFAFLL